jgi:GDPmannose 4,6-dehydratase
MIFGTTGQDGSYLTENLLAHDYCVVGIARRCSHNNAERISHIINPKFQVVEGDVSDHSHIINLLKEYKPTHIFNLAAQSHVGSSFKQPIYTFDVTAGGTLNILEAIRQVNTNTRFYQASSSEIFGDQVGPNNDQDENTLKNPQSPYAIAKLAAYQFTQLYRQSYGIFASNGILFNHESKRRGTNFVTRKITKWIGKYVTWRAKCRDISQRNTIDINNITDEYSHKTFPKLRLGNLNVCRDWGHAADYVEAMRLMLEADHPDDFIIATGKTYTIKEFLQEAFAVADIEYWEKYIVIDPELYRPSDVPFLKGNSTKARKELGWKPTISFKEMVREMVENDIKIEGAK